jgi:hypothetical protein
VDGEIFCRRGLSANVVAFGQQSEIAYCRGGIGARDDDGAVGTRDDDGDAGGLRAGAAGGCGGGSGVFKSISATADSSLPMSRAIES